MKTSRGKQPEVNAWIVWHRGTGNIFTNETEAMDFIYSEREKSPDYVFDGWRQTFRGNNMSTILSGFDKIHQLQEAERYNHFFGATPPKQELNKEVI